MIIHIAGVDITLHGTHLRQRCSWCGYVLMEYDLTRVAVPIGQDPTPGRWEIGALVAVDGDCSWTVEPEFSESGEQNKLPDGACALLPPEMTA